jgi:3-hydroxy-3-methylglutaryl CoA synthase
MSDIGITAFGAYVPRLRITRASIAAAHGWMAPGLKAQAKGSRAFKSWDEDPITMAVEAIRDAAGTAGLANFDALRLASTNFPYADLQSASIVASALGAPATIASSDVGGSQRAGTSALLQALRTAERSMVVAADSPRAKPASGQELSYGAGAAAFATGSEGVIARLIGAATITAPLVDHFRSAGAAYDYFWEERWVRDEGYGKIVPAVAKAALADAGIGIDGVAHFVMPSLLRGAAEAAAKRLGFTGKVAAPLDDGVGYAGTAHALLMLANVLEQAAPGERILLIGFGQGADALVLEATDAIGGHPPARGVTGAITDALPTDSYLRMLSFYDGIDLEWGMRSEKSGKTALTEQYRSSHQIDGFVAGRCGTCETVQFPQHQFCVHCHAPADGFVDSPLRDAPAKVMTATADWLTYHPAPPLYVGFIQFENGARVLMEIVDVGPAGIEAGAEVRMVYRIREKDRQRGYNRYFWKATPVAAQGE